MKHYILVEIEDETCATEQWQRDIVKGLSGVSYASHENVRTADVTGMLSAVDPMFRMRDELS